MKKNYFVMAVLLLAAGFTNAQTTTTEPTFVITKIEAPQGKEGIVYTGSKNDAAIEIKLQNVTKMTWANSFSIHCLAEPNVFTDYPYVELVGTANGGNSSSEHSFVEIHSLGTAHIEKVEFVLGSTGVSKLVCAPSIDGTDYFGDYELDVPPYTVNKRIQAAGYDDICNSGYSYEVPDEVLTADGDPVGGIREKVKYVRLNWGKSFAGAATPDKGASASLFAIKVYTNAQTTPTDIEQEETYQPALRLYGKNLQLNEISDVTVFDIAGKIVAQHSQVDNAYLDNLSSGIYVLCAVNANGTTTTQKVVIK